MNIEEAIEKILIKIRTGKEVTIGDDTIIETLLTAYEKEKGENNNWKNYVTNDLEKQITEKNNKIFKLEAELEKEKEKNKELENRNKELNIIRLEYLVSQFPDTTETYKKYKKELDEAISNLNGGINNDR